MNPLRILIAGLGNIFLGDDGFGVEVARRLAQRSLPNNIRLIDCGIRGYDLAFALLDQYDAVILIDAVQRGHEPGTLYLLRITESDLEAAAPIVSDGHTLDPFNVLRLASTMGGFSPRNVHLIGCEPAALSNDAERLGVLSPPVEGAIDEALAMIDSLIADTLNESPCTNSPSR